MGFFALYRLLINSYEIDPIETNLLCKPVLVILHFMNGSVKCVLPVGKFKNILAIGKGFQT